MESSGNPGTGLVIFLILVLLDAVLSAFSSAVKAMNESELERKSKEGESRAIWIYQMKLEPGRLDEAVFISSTLISMLAGSILVRLLGDIWKQYLMGTVVQTFLAHGMILVFAYASVALLVLLVLYAFGILLPQRIGACYPEGVGYGLRGVAQLLITIFRPFTYLTGSLVHLILKIFQVDLKRMQEDVTEEEIISMVNEGHEQGVLEASEAEMIHNIFELGDKEAQDIMTHRKNIIALNGDKNLKETMEIILESTNSRFPVFEENIDNITGILHLKDAMRMHNKGGYDEWLIRDIPELIRPAVFIPETRNISQLFQSMQSQKIQMVIVADEYGQTAGLIALEDILEEIVGNIMDEYDVDEKFIEKNQDGTYFMNGMTPLENIEDLLGVQLQEDEYETLNGFLIYRIGHIPQPEEEAVIQEAGYLFRILQVSNKVIEKVLVYKLPETEENSVEDK